MRSAKTPTSENNDSALWKIRQHEAMGKVHKYCMDSE